MKGKGPGRQPRTSDKWRADRPYNDLPPLPPAGELESRTVLKQCIVARAALAELKVATELIPNPTILLNSILLLEAQASSEIENIVTSADELFRRVEASDPGDAATREALRYRRALLEGAASLQVKPLSTWTAEVVCTEVKGVEMRVRRVPGTQLVNSASRAVSYTPPVGEDRIRRLLSNWEAFLHEAPTTDGMDPLVKMAVLHYQFEAIHPFTDGNGRTGRVINSLFLVARGLLPQPILYLSRYIIEHKQEYYRLLLGVTRDAAWEDWVLFMLRGIELTARWTIAKIAAIRALSGEIAERIRAAYPRLYSRDLVDVIFEQPYCRIRNLVERGVGTRQLASRQLHALVKGGILREVRLGRERLFLNHRLLRLLEAR
ncbi:MAG: filamentation induced by cAMP protein Fic [Gemmatimonadetes bacterium]|nr:filamentation induced by cAMP protein Fic [Gemmatimonadota bacterium]